ncbi:hypothetical protein [Microcoleus sp. FACHB-68]|uniref:hypothetical protein n=1 Tax=Microcoleus sp. FACHB-68 TaxID=2692826 RepID=UPI001683DF52|nr:hypothetical protein [Microcoleus sp. FACHB-68]MBD1937829.1 hypothetical protein [Microcoleus sp. FACHB-68]
MADKQVADLTLEELKGLIAQVVDQRLRHEQQPQRPVDKEALKKTLESIDSHMWTPPPGAPSTLEMLREDRGR